MPNDSSHDDGAIIETAYAEKIREVFKVFAENLAMGENERSSRDRFLRSVEQARKARDIALAAVAGIGAPADTEAAPAAQPGAATADGLSAEERAMVEQALAGTTGQRAAAPLLGATARPPFLRR
ncbi:MAG TPA: hypothetical protein VMF86_09135 [Stellaceae bacterium]|nr:hypothetical protein [Stellaceae bacterium]